MTPPEPGSGLVIVQGHNRASEKLQRVRKWSVATYMVRRAFYHCSMIQDGIAHIDLIDSHTLVSAVYQAGSVREARARISYGGSPTRASSGGAQRRPTTLRKHHQAGSDAGQSARSVYSYPEDPGRRLQRAQHQNTNAACESQNNGRSHHRTVSVAHAFCSVRWSLVPTLRLRSSCPAVGRVCRKPSPPSRWT